MGRGFEGKGVCVTYICAGDACALLLVVAATSSSQSFKPKLNFRTAACESSSEKYGFAERAVEVFFRWNGWFEMKRLVSRLG